MGRFINLGIAIVNTSYIIALTGTTPTIGIRTQSALPAA